MSQIHTIRTYNSPFLKLKSKEKTIDLRLNDEKRQKIQVDDLVEFINTTTGDKLLAKVIELHKFNNFKELYQKLDLLKCGYTPENISTANPKDMGEYYSSKEIERHGVIGIEVDILKYIESDGE